MAARKNPDHGPQMTALTVTVTELRRREALTPAEEALVAVAEGLATVLDANPAADSRYWGQYQAALKALREVGADDGDDDGIAGLIAAIRGDASMVDTED